MIFAAFLLLKPIEILAEPDPLRVEPSSPWQLDYSDDSCRLARVFGEGNDAIILIFDRYQPQDSFYLLVAGRHFRSTRTISEAQIRFGDHEPEQEISVAAGDLDDISALIFTTSLRIAPYSEADNAEIDRVSIGLAEGEWFAFEAEPISEERYRQAEYIWIDAPRMQPIRLETGSLEEPFAAFDTCIEELMTHWGIDAEAHRDLTRPVIPLTSPDNWVVSSDYPRAELRQGGQGLVFFRLSVDANGRATDCHIQRSTRSEHFKEAACEALLRNAEFAPALDAGGNPIASYFATTVYFTMRR